MGEARKDALRVGFDRAIKLEFHGARVSSDAGLFPYRDLDDAARLTESVTADLFDFRTASRAKDNALMSTWRHVGPYRTCKSNRNSIVNTSLSLLFERVEGRKSLSCRPLPVVMNIQCCDWTHSAEPRAEVMALIKRTR